MPDNPEQPAPPQDNGVVTAATNGASAVTNTKIATQTGEISKNFFDARRILPSQDVIANFDRLDQNPEKISAFVADRTLASTHFFEGLQSLSGHYDLLVQKATPDWPAQLIGTLLQPSGIAAQSISVSVILPDTGGKIAWSSPLVITDDHGTFTIKLPANSLPTNADPTGAIRLEFKGANDSDANNKITLKDLGAAGLIGNVALTKTLQPLPRGIVSSLQNLFGSLATPATEAASASDPMALKQVTLGEGGCAISFQQSVPNERFPYSVLIRLIEPRTSIVTETLTFKGENGFYQLAKRGVNWNFGLQAKSSFTDRVAVDQPISVDGFRDQIMGNQNNIVTPEETVPMAGTLGLGYVVRMAQQWKQTGLSLGDLVYSLPLAPGEQQRVAVFEQRQTQSVFDSESLNEEEQQRQSQENDSSAQATFSSAFTESVRGSSSYATHADSSSWGVAGGLGLAIGPLVLGGGAAGGGGSANSRGNSQQALDGARNYSNQATEHMHSSVERQASARRHAQRTSIRLASATDTEIATTKVITNNNRTHALTIQYWEVLRNFEIATAVEGVTLVCFVPLEVVRFLPGGVMFNLTDVTPIKTRAGFVNRYNQLYKHSDVLRRWLPRKYQQGMNLLEGFMSDPNAVPDLDSLAEDVIDLNLTASMLPFEDLYVSLVTKWGSRIGPVRMSGSGIKDLPDRIKNPDTAFTTETDLLAELHHRRDEEPAIAMSAKIALPNTVAPSDIAGFELSHTFRSLNYQLAPKKEDLLNQIVGGLAQNPLGVGLFGLIEGPMRAALHGVVMSPSQLERELGGPFVQNFSAHTEAPGGGHSENYVSNYLPGKFQLPSSAYPVPANQVSPLLRMKDLLKIEAVLQHVVHNTISYSRAVWMSLTPEERAIMLEGYTIGVPKDGFSKDPTTDLTQNIPLLNCVGNQVLGFYGNSMILPFTIPIEMTQRLGGANDNGQPLTTGLIQDALTNFHRTKFSPPVSHVALPTRGVLGEAVLGSCSSAEKIDLTRFWNWSDSPIPQAGEISPVTIGKDNLLSNLQTSNVLAGQPTTINFSGLSTGNAGDIIKLLTGAAEAGSKSFDPSLTGAKELADLTGKTLATAESARADALGKAQSMASEALKQLPEVLKAQTSAKEAAKKEANDQKAADDKQATDDKKTASETAKTAFNELKSNADSYLQVVNHLGDDNARKDYAKKVVDELTDSKGLPISLASQLFNQYQSSRAFLEALGLPAS